MNTLIKTPDQRLRVYVSSTIEELSKERKAIKDAILGLNLIPVMFEQGARPYPPRDLYTAYMQQSHIFLGMYWQEHGWISEHAEESNLYDEFELSSEMPRLIYIKNPAPDRSPQLSQLIDRIRESGVSYRSFSDPLELKELVVNDLSILLTERFELSLDGQHDGLESDILNENYPFPAVPIIGREKAINDLLYLIHDPGTKLITISGVGGIGKTRLGLELLHRVKIHKFFKVCFVPLGSITDPKGVGETILRSAFPMANVQGSALQLLAQLIGEKKILLLLDNFEHVMSSRLVIADLLRNCPNLKIVVTSRELLHLSGESEYALSPLPYDAEIVDLFNIPPSMELFVQRARSMHPHFTINSENYYAIKEICSLLDGIPLAIELAAARARLLTPSQILSLLRKDLDFLKSDNHDVPARHQTLRSAVDWSFRLLQNDEQRLLCMLSTFTGGATLEAAAIMVEDPNTLLEVWPFPRTGFYTSNPTFPTISEQVSEVDFLEAVESLLSKSLVYTSVNKYGVLRINFYQTIQYYCQDKLKEIGLNEEANSKHLYYYLFLAESLWDKLKSEEAYEAYELLDNDIHNIEKAMQQSLQFDPISGLRIAIAMSEYWDTRGNSKDAVKWLETFLFALPDLEKKDFVISAIAKLELSRALFRLAEFEKAWNILEECHKEALATNREFIVADTIILHNLINVYAHWNDRKEELINEGLSLTRKLGYEMALLDAIQHKAADRIFSGQIEEGIPLAIESLELSKKLKAKRWEAIAHIFLGFGYFMASNISDSTFHFKKVLECTSGLSDQLLPVYSLLGLSQITLAKKDMRMTGLLLGTVDTFINRPGTSLVPIVKQIHSSLLETVDMLQSTSLMAYMEEGRKMKISDMIDMVLEKDLLVGTEGPGKRIHAKAR